jgi:hypothetical protein
MLEQVGSNAAGATMCPTKVFQLAAFGVVPNGINGVTRVVLTLGGVPHLEKVSVNTIPLERC